MKGGIAAALALLSPVVILAQQPAETDIDSFMSRTLERREINWEALHGYIFNETESLELRGPAIPPLASFKRDYVWFVRDGRLVRSPLRANGVRVPREEQGAYEKRWIERKERDSLERESFFKFKFEAGRYLFAGMRKFEGREVAVIEYYPRRGSFDDHEDRNSNEKDGGDKYEDMLYKTSRVTLLVAPGEHQIVHFNFENVGLEFLPYRWIVRMDELSASLTMHKPLGDIWLPREIRASGNVTTAGARFSASYRRVFYDYARTDVRVKLRFETDDLEKRRP